LRTRFADIDYSRRGALDAPLTRDSQFFERPILNLPYAYPARRCRPVASSVADAIRFWERIMRRGS
jgi:hypothetical protein